MRGLWGLWGLRGLRGLRLLRGVRGLRIHLIIVVDASGRGWRTVQQATNLQ